MALFSIIVPIFNAEKYINKCLDSLIAQTLNDFEIICVDDCGQDNSIQIVEKYAQKDCRIKILHQTYNKGVAAARNLALDNATGDYILCVDADDWIEENTLEKLYNAFKKSSCTSIWFDGYRYYQNSKNYSKEPINSNKNGYINLTPETLFSFSDMCGMKAYTTKSIKSINLHWPEGINMDEDGEFYFKYYYHHTKVYAIEDCLYFYRKHTESLASMYSSGKSGIDDTYKVIEHLKNYYTANGVFEKYKITLLKLIENRINFCKNTNYTKENKKLTLEFLNKINFVEDFSFFPKIENPLVSIIIPIYNSQLYIEQCLKSIIKQTYKNIEILCIDDCSQDNSIKIVKQLAQKDNRIKLFKHKKNKGPGGARNTGIKKAKGIYTLFVDSDDWITEDCVSTAINKMIETGYNSVWFKANFWMESSQKSESIKFYEKFMNMQEKDLIINENNILNFMTVPWNKAYKTEILKQKDLSWMENVIYEDDLFYWKMYTKYPQTYIIDKPMYYYRQHSESIVHKNLNDIEKVKNTFIIVSEIYKYLKTNNLYQKYNLIFLNYAYEILNKFNYVISNTNILKQEKLNFIKKIFQLSS